MRSSVVVLNKGDNDLSNSPPDYDIQYVQGPKRNSLMSNSTWYQHPGGSVAPEPPVKRMSMRPNNYSSPDSQPIKRNSMMPPEPKISKRNSMMRYSPIEEPEYHSSPQDIPIYVDKRKSIRSPQKIRPELYLSPVPPDSARSKQSMSQNNQQRRQTMNPRPSQFLQRPNVDFDNYSNIAKPKEIRKIASGLQQIRMLLWKNVIISFRSIGTIIAEFLGPIIFLGLIILVRYLFSVYSYPAQSNSLKNVFELYSPIVSGIAQPIVLYYPNNSFILGIVKNAVNVIQAAVPSYTPNITASSVATGSLVDSGTLANLSAFVAFPSTYTSSLPSNVQYTIYTQE